MTAFHAAWLASIDGAELWTPCVCYSPASSSKSLRELRTMREGIWNCTSSPSDSLAMPCSRYKNQPSCLYVRHNNNFHRVKSHQHAFSHAAAHPTLSGSRSRLLVHRFQCPHKCHCALLHTQLHGIWLSLRFSAISCRPHDKSHRNDRITILRIRECHRVVLD
jgi:hypothetical protein